jgi:muramoyltetrapeptide carboxypeptidase
LSSRTHPPAARARRPSIGFFAPSGYLPDPALMDRAALYLTGAGWRVSAGESVFAREQRFAGPDELRAGELQRFATDATLDVAIAARGGYGLSRLLDRFDYEAIAAAGKPLVGYSDFTAFNLALLARAGGISFQGPAASDFANAGATVDARVDDACHPRAAGAADTADGVEEAEAAAAFTMSHFFGALAQAVHTVEFDASHDAVCAAVSPAVSAPDVALDVRGRLWGGNLSMMCSLLGTPYFPHVRGGILFLEDVNEPVYRIERMLLQLLHAGVLARQKAIVMGEFSMVPALSNDNGFCLDAALVALRARCAVPIVRGLPFGHGRRRVTLPVGAPGRLTVAGTRARLQFHGHPLVRA